MATIGLWNPVDRLGLSNDHRMKISENPRDKFYLTVCFVCKDVAKPGQEHLRNYGGIVCYSCRAFWRRSHQATRNPNFICKRSNDCCITVATRRRCQKCRYQRCLIAGMNPEAVLNDDQKKIRFRKLLMKRQKQLARQIKSKIMTEKKCSEWKNPEKKYFNDLYQDDSESIHSDASMEEHFSTPRQVYPHSAMQNFDPRRIPQFYMDQTPTFNPRECYVRPAYNQSQYYYQFMRSRGFFTEAQLDALHNYNNNVAKSREYEVYQEKNLYNKPTPSRPSTGSSLSEVTDFYSSAMQTVRCPRVMNLIEKLSALKSNSEIIFPISKREVQLLTFRLSDAFTRFAMSLREFSSLHFSDQEKLLACNTPLFVQLFLGHHLMVDQGKGSGSTEMEEKPRKKLWMTNFEQKEFLERFSIATNLFIDGADLDEYGRLITKLKSISELAMSDQRAILAYTILFNRNHLEGNAYLESIFDTYVGKLSNKVSLSTLTSTLKEMVHFCTDNFEWNEI